MRIFGSQTKCLGTVGRCSRLSQLSIVVLYQIAATAAAATHPVYTDWNKIEPGNEFTLYLSWQLTVGQKLIAYLSIFCDQMLFERWLYSLDEADTIHHIYMTILGVRCTTSLAPYLSHVEVATFTYMDTYWGPNLPKKPGHCQYFCLK